MSFILSTAAIISLLPNAGLSDAGAAGTEAFLTAPDIHGDQVVFTAEGDLWLANVDTGDARRLTSDPGVETDAHFSPDGTQIAFTAMYDGMPNVYVMPSEGGVPKRLTYDPRLARVVGWTPDGKNVIFRSNSKIYAPSVEQFATWELFTVAATGGLPKKVAVPRGSFASMNGDGHTLAFVPTSNEWMNWYRYEAGEADKIWLADLATGKFTQLTNSNDVDTQPTWAGKAIYFVSERSGLRNLWRLDPSTKAVKQITTFNDYAVRRPSSDGKRVVFEAGPSLDLYDPSTGQVRALAIHLHSDRIHARPFQWPVAAAADAGIGPTGKRVALVSRGHLVTVPTEEGTMHTLVSDSSQRVQDPVWSPDGKRIVYVSDASGEEQLYITDAIDGSSPKQVTKDLGGENGSPVWSPDAKLFVIGNRDATIKLVDATTGAIKQINRSNGPLSYDNVMSDFTFSPDSKWVAYGSYDNRTSQVFLYNVASGTSTLVSEPTIDSASPQFSPDGKYLFFGQSRVVSERFGQNGRISHDYSMAITGITLAKDTPTPFLDKDVEEAEPAKKPDAAPAKELKIDLDGIADRYFDCKVPAGQYEALFAIPGKLLLQQGPTILSFDLTSKAITPLASGVAAVQLSQDMKKLLVRGPGGFQVIDTMGGPTPPGAGALKLAGLTVTIDPVAEWRQIFYETWRVGRDFFYDPNTHGVNWKAVKTKYEKELPLVANRADLTAVLASMISEFNTGHCYVGGPVPFVARSDRQGLLGVDLVWDGAAGAYKIKHILKGDAWDPNDRSPFAEPGLKVHEGDYLLKIRGQALQRDQDPSQLLLGSSGLKISVTTNGKPSLDGAQTVTITPMASEGTLRLQDWINGRKAYVEKASGGQIGYVYVGDMGETGSNQFAEQYYPNVDKPGIIVDVRGNGGGNISGNLLDDLSSKIDGFFAFRSGGTFRRAGWAPLGQVVAVTNEFAFSDGEYFSEFFKRLKIGPLVGHRTGGGEVGSGGGYAMVDGGSVYIPNYGAWVPGEWVVEGRGAVPDYEVDQDPASMMAGKDPQLDKAISLIMDNLKKHPFQAPQHPPFPVKLKGSRG